MSELSPGAATTKSPPGTGSVTDPHLLAGQLFNETWRLMKQEGRTAADDDRMMHAAHASLGQAEVDRLWTAGLELDAAAAAGLALEPPR